ncbi:MAG TPA: hypothetical protein VGM64_06350 [Lacunisphaera sp.]|jgi:hypothetical protein
MKIGDIIELSDKTGSVLGRFRVEEEKSEALCGVFKPSDGFDAVRSVFEEFASMVESQSFAYLDETEEKIAALGVRGHLGSTRIEITDLQIYRDGASLRVAPEHRLKPEPIQPPQTTTGSCAPDRV